MKRIGVDIGGTTVKGALFDGETLSREHSVPTHGREGREAIFAALFAVLDSLFEDGVAVIGISSAGNIDPATGVCVYATDNLMGWTGVKIKEEAEKRYSVPVRVENDAISALLGELLFYPSLQDVTMLTFGTGVGGASLVGGKILRGQAFDAARWGHVNLVPSGRICSCGRRGCAESYLSANALLSIARRSVKGLTSTKELFALLDKGDEEAEKIVKQFAGRLELLLWNVRTVLSPQKIVLGGGLMNSYSEIIKYLNKTDDLAPARLGGRAGIYGVAFGKEERK